MDGYRFVERASSIASKTDVRDKQIWKINSEIGLGEGKTKRYVHNSRQYK